MRQVVLTGGGDWTDASVGFVSVPDGFDIDKAYWRWQKWYREEYLPVGIDHRKRYLTFRDFLVEREGCQSWEPEQFHEL